MEAAVNKRGYLNSDFLFFHLKDRSFEEMNFHYHEFDKLVILLFGKASYIIEGREYFLTPGDILLVNHHEIHKPVVKADIAYDRIVIWINREFLERSGSPSTDLTQAFRLAAEQNMHLFKVDKRSASRLNEILQTLEHENSSAEYGADIAARAMCLELLALTNRLAIGEAANNNDRYCRYDEKISQVISYINSSLNSDLSADGLAARFYISRSQLMHKFKAETGYSLHSYILSKRLLHAKQLLLDGTPVTEAAQASGFEDYSTFLRAFKKTFGCLPRDY